MSHGKHQHQRRKIGAPLRRASRPAALVREDGETAEEYLYRLSQRWTVPSPVIRQEVYGELFMATVFLDRSLVSWAVSDVWEEARELALERTAGRLKYVQSTVFLQTKILESERGTKNEIRVWHALRAEIARGSSWLHHFRTANPQEDIAGTDFFLWTKKRQEGSGIALQVKSSRSSAQQFSIHHPSTVVLVVELQDTEELILQNLQRFIRGNIYVCSAL